MGRPRERENVFSGRSDCVFRQTLNRFPRCYQRFPPDVESALLLASVRNGADAKPQSWGGSRFWVDDAFDFIAVPLARAGDDGETVEGCGTSGVAGLFVFCSAGESGLLCRFMLSAFGRRVTARRGCSVARGASFGPMDTSYPAWQRLTIRWPGDSSRFVLCSARHGSHQDLWMGPFRCTSVLPWPI